MSFIAEMLGQRGGKPTDYSDIVFGKVISVSPLSIQYDPAKPNLPESLLDLSQHVQKYELDVEIVASCPHGAVTASKLIVDNSLKVGDEVAMVRRDGGKRFYVLEKRKTI